jgi:hypothetical protein
MEKLLDSPIKILGAVITLIEAILTLILTRSNPTESQKTWIIVGMIFSLVFTTNCCCHCLLD